MQEQKYSVKTTQVQEQKQFAMFVDFYVMSCMLNLPAAAIMLLSGVTSREFTCWCLS